MDRSCAIPLALASSLALSLPPALPAVASATRVSAPEAKFTGEVLPAGTKLVVCSATTRNLIVAKPGKSATEAVSSGTESATVNCTATVVQSKESIDRMRIDFGDCPYRTSVRSKNPPRELPFARKSCDLYRKDGKNVFAGVGEKDLSDLERLAVQPHFLPLTFELPLAALLGGKTVKKGDKLELPAESAGRLLAPYRTLLPGGKTTLTMTDEKVIDGQECAVFTIAASLPLFGHAPTGSGISIELAGEITVTKRHCLVVYAKCEGVCAEGKATKDAPSLPKGLVKETWEYYVKPG